MRLYFRHLSLRTRRLNARVTAIRAAAGEGRPNMQGNLLDVPLLFQAGNDELPILQVGGSRNAAS